MMVPLERRSMRSFLNVPLSCYPLILVCFLLTLPSSGVSQTIIPNLPAIQTKVSNDKDNKTIPAALASALGLGNQELSATQLTGLWSFHESRVAVVSFEGKTWMIFMELLHDSGSGNIYLTQIDGILKKSCYSHKGASYTDNDIKDRSILADFSAAKIYWQMTLFPAQR